MKKSSAAIAAILSAAAASSVKAQLVYEPFDYGSAAVGTKYADLTGTPTFTGYTNPSSGTPWYSLSTGTTGALGTPESVVNGTSLSAPAGLAPTYGGKARSN